MTALKNSGMHIVFTFTPEELHRMVRHLFFLNYLVPAPEGYDVYCLTPAQLTENTGYLGTTYDEWRAYHEWSTQVLRSGRSVPEFIIPVHLDAQPSELTGGVDLQVKFGIDAHLDGQEVCVTVNFLDVTPDAEGVGELLTARSPARWWIPLDWLSAPGLPIVPEAVATSFVTWSNTPAEPMPESHRYPAVAIGVALQDIPGAQPEQFTHDIDLTENATTEYVALMRNIRHPPQIALSTEVATRLLDLFVEEILDFERRHQRTGDRPFGIFGIGEFVYEITGLEIEWPTQYDDSVTCRASGRIYFLSEWRDMELTSEVSFFPGCSAYSEDIKLDMYMGTTVPENLHLIHEPELETDLQQTMDYHYTGFRSSDSISPSRHLALRPDGLGTVPLCCERYAHATPFEFIITRLPLVDLNPNYIRFVEFDPDTAAIEVDKDALEIEFIYHYAGLLLTCSGGSRPWVDADDNLWSSFRISNTGGVPVGIAVTTDRLDLLNLRGGTQTLLPGEAVDVSVEFRTDHLPFFYDSDAQERFDATIYVRHSACNLPTIPIRFSAQVTYDLRLGTISDAKRNALCGFADVMMLKYGILALGDDAFGDHPDYTPIYTVSIQDESDRYEFIAQDEAGNPVAMEATHSLHKTMQIPVAEDDSIPLSVRYRASHQAGKDPFYWTLRGFFIQPTAEVKIEGLKALTPCSGGAVAVGAAGVFLLDTTAPKRSVARLALKDEQSLVAVASSKNDIYAIGDDRLVIMNVSGSGEVAVVQTMRLGASAHLIRRYGDRLWIAGQDVLSVVAHQHGKEVEQVATTKLKAPARDISVHRGRVTLLVDGGLHFYAFDGSELKLTGSYALKECANATLLPRGELVGVTDPKQGTFFLDVSRVKEPEVVATYAKAHWKSNLAIDITRGITYSADFRTAMANVGRFRTLKLRGWY